MRFKVGNDLWLVEGGAVLSLPGVQQPDAVRGSDNSDGEMCCRAGDLLRFVLARDVLLQPLMLAQVQSAGVLGVEAFAVCTEVDVALGLPGYHLVGLGASAVKEGGVRVRAALLHSGWKLPARKVTINLAPADIRKDGAAFDLPIALAILTAQEIVPAAALDGVMALGELGLDGSLRPIAGALPAGMLARARHARALILPAGSAGEAAALRDVLVLGASSLAEVVAHLTGGPPLARVAEPKELPVDPNAGVDLADVCGQEHAKLALEIAAAGGHNLLMVGAPGTGKSMLARRLPSILPSLSLDEALETSAVYSSAGQLGGAALVRARPFRAPHHDVSVAGLIGGGSVPRPGEISMAHNGVLFLDELLEFKRGALESLRQPIEDREVTVVRARASIRFPAAFALVAAMNPCPCGYAGSTVRACVCDLGIIRRYRARLSGPLLDRFDLQVQVPSVDFRMLTTSRRGDSSSVVRERVIEARARQRHRLQGTPLHSNAQLGVRELGRYCRLDDRCHTILADLADRRGLSARAVHRLLRVARTLADLAGREELAKVDVQAAVDFRLLDEQS